MCAACGSLAVAKCVVCVISSHPTANIGERLGETLNSIDPRLGAIYNSSTEGVNEMLRGIAGAQQDAVERYFRATNLRMVRGLIYTPASLPVSHWLRHLGSIATARLNGHVLPAPIDQASSAC